MSPREKAIELVDKFKDEFNWVEKDYNVDLYREAKQCALIAVDEIIDECRIGMDWFWQEVKEEIELL
jgi:hypothetical protein